MQQSWAEDHARGDRHHQAELAQVTTHPDHEGESGSDSQRLQQTLAGDHARENRLHDIGIAMERPTEILRIAKKSAGVNPALVGCSERPDQAS